MNTRLDGGARDSLTPPPLPSRPDRTGAHRLVAAVLALLVLLGGGLAVLAVTGTGPFADDGPAPATPAPSAAPDTTPGTPATPPTTAPATPSPSAAAWPAPPERRGTGDWRPWTLPGYDYGAVVAADLEAGHAVLTFDRMQLYTAEQWKAKTGKDWDMDFRIVNESRRTRRFVVEDDAPLYGNWAMTDSGTVRRYSPRAFVARIDALLARQAQRQLEWPDVPGDVRPEIGFFLFHRDGPDGPVAYAEEATMFTG
jgi:hypothetical protein